MRALDASAANGGGTVHLPAGRQYLMWPFEITHSHVHVRIDGAIVCPMRLALWGTLQILPLMQTRMAAVGLEGGGSIRVVSAAGDKKVSLSTVRRLSDRGFAERVNSTCLGAVLSAGCSNIILAQKLKFLVPGLKTKRSRPFRLRL